MTTQLRLEGEGAAELAEELSKLLESLIGKPPTIMKVEPDDETLRGDPLVVATFILAIPQAVKATIDLVERARVAQKAARLKEKARRSRASATLCRNQTLLDLETVSEDDIVDILISK